MVIGDTSSQSSLPPCKLAHMPCKRTHAAHMHTRQCPDCASNIQGVISKQERCTAQCTTQQTGASNTSKRRANREADEEETKNRGVQQLPLHSPHTQCTLIIKQPASHAAKMKAVHHMIQRIKAVLTAMHAWTLELYYMDCRLCLPSIQHKHPIITQLTYYSHPCKVPVFCSTAERTQELRQQVLDTLLMIFPASLP